MADHSPEPKAAAATTQLDPAIENARQIFHEVWTELETTLGRTALRFPKEIIWLNGAPGAGKGTNTPFILRERSITAPPIVIADLLDTPEFQRIKDSGNLINDRVVLLLLMRKLLDPLYVNGVVADGFPRTLIQVECLKHFYHRMLELRKEFYPTPLAEHFPRPLFRIAVLFVEEKESVERQLKRGRQVIAHNQRVRDTGVGELLEERATDFSEDASRKRYRIFKDHAYHSLQSLRQIFHFHIINAQGDIASVERAIIKEFQYQSSLELDEETLDAINHIPLASDIVLNARQNLVRRLESYQREHAALFKRVIRAIEAEFMPAIQIHAVTGAARISSEDELFADPRARTMLIDILNERGYLAAVAVEGRLIPTAVDPATHAIVSISKPRYQFEIRFHGSAIRRG